MKKGEEYVRTVADYVETRVQEVASTARTADLARIAFMPAITLAEKWFDLSTQKLYAHIGFEIERLITTINWLHKSHPRTTTIPAAFADGECAVWPFRLHIAPVYFFPSVEQHGLLYQLLFFHEFGHLLYVFHKPRMDELVRNLQRAIEDRLIPASQRNDRYVDIQAAERLAVSFTWYRWTQEFFCDTVGLSVGGPCFLRAFSGYLGTMDRGDFH